MTKRSRRFRRDTARRIRPIRNWDAARHNGNTWPGSARAESHTEDDERAFEPDMPTDARGFAPRSMGPHSHRPSSRPWDGRPMGMGDWAQESEDPWGDHAAGGWEDDSNYPGRGHSWPGSLDEGVRLGYQIVEDHIRRGERASHHFAERAMGSMRSGDGLWELFLRLVQASGPIAAAGSQFLDALARLGRPPHHRFGSQHFEPRWADSHWSEHEAYGPDGSTEPDAPWNWPESAPGMSPHSDDLADTGEGEDEIRFRVRLDLGRPIVLELCLDTWAQSTEIQVQELVSSDPSLPPLQGIEFDTGEGWLDVHVGSLEAPPPGVYTGIVLESSSGEPCGELTARVGAPTPSPHPSDEAPVDEPMYPQDELET